MNSNIQPKKPLIQGDKYPQSKHYESGDIKANLNRNDWVLFNKEGKVINQNGDIDDAKIPRARAYCKFN
jgi:hypothetical protein